MVLYRGLVSIPKRVLEALKLRSPRVCRLAERFVSIPKRVLEALKQFLLLFGRYGELVSIPKRVLEALKQV